MKRADAFRFYDLARTTDAVAANLDRFWWCCRDSGFRVQALEPLARVVRGLRVSRDLLVDEALRELGTASTGARLD